MFLLQKGHREVIKALLENNNWHKLFLRESASGKPIISAVSLLDGLIESPQLNSLYENKMWDMIQLVLDNCQKGDDFDFSVLDPPECQNINQHPLMLLAKSGQETLLKHDTTSMLLNLKWRFIPRLVYYSNLFFYLIFLLLFCFYCLDLQKNYKTVNVLSGGVLTEQNQKNVSAILICIQYI